VAISTIIDSLSDPQKWRGCRVCISATELLVKQSQHSFQSPDNWNHRFMVQRVMLPVYQALLMW